jgi:hypothetical protein
MLSTRCVRLRFVDDLPKECYRGGFRRRRLDHPHHVAGWSMQSTPSRRRSGSTAALQGRFRRKSAGLRVMDHSQRASCQIITHSRIGDQSHVDPILPPDMFVGADQVGDWLRAGRDRGPRFERWRRGYRRLNHDRQRRQVRGGRQRKNGQSPNAGGSCSLTCPDSNSGSTKGMP